MSRFYFRFWQNLGEVAIAHLYRLDPTALFLCPINFFYISMDFLFSIFRLAHYLSFESFHIWPRSAGRSTWSMGKQEQNDASFQKTRGCSRVTGSLFLLQCPRRGPWRWRSRWCCCISSTSSQNAQGWPTSMDRNSQSIANAIHGWWSSLPPNSFITCFSAITIRQRLIQKSVKWTHHTYACNSLTNFEYEAQAVTGNGSTNGPIFTTHCYCYIAIDDDRHYHQIPL